jgi:protein TonB
MFDDFGKTSARESRRRLGGSFLLACAVCGVGSIAAVRATATVQAKQAEPDEWLILPRSLRPAVKDAPPPTPKQPKGPITHSERTRPPRPHVDPAPRTPPPLVNDEGESSNTDELLLGGVSTPPAPPPALPPAPPPQDLRVVPPVDTGNNHYDKLQYPVAAERRGIQGTVTVAFDVSESGAVVNPRILLGPKELHGAVLKAAAGWRFKPALQAGKPVRYLGMTRRVVFRLEDA